MYNATTAMEVYTKRRPRIQLLCAPAIDGPWHSERQEVQYRLE